MTTDHDDDAGQNGAGRGRRGEADIERARLRRTTERRKTERALREALCHILGNTCRLSRATMTFGWNAHGPGASARAGMLGVQAGEMHSALDPIAAHIVGLGIPPVLDYTDVNLTLRLPTLPDADAGLPDGAAAMRLLADAQEEAAGSVEAAIDVALMAENQASLILLTGRLEAHRAHAHALRREIA